MNLCKTCGTICPFDDERTECDAYAPMTNENWFISLSTEEKAKFLRQIYRDGRDDYVGEWHEQTEADFVEWLKEKHE